MALEFKHAKLNPVLIFFTSISSVTLFNYSYFKTRNDFSMFETSTITRKTSSCLFPPIFNCCAIGLSRGKCITLHSMNSLPKKVAISFI
uniref:Uncharacterized protein n=1 Tax=Setaria italica TaxID=4555 RepID=K4AHA1_SETIT